MQQKAAFSTGQVGCAARSSKCSKNQLSLWDRLVVLQGAASAAKSCFLHRTGWLCCKELQVQQNAAFFTGQVGCAVSILADN